MIDLQTTLSNIMGQVTGNGLCLPGLGDKAHLMVEGFVGGPGSICRRKAKPKPDVWFGGMGSLLPRLRLLAVTCQAPCAEDFCRFGVACVSCRLRRRVHHHPRNWMCIKASEVCSSHEGLSWRAKRGLSVGMLLGPVPVFFEDAQHKIDAIEHTSPLCTKLSVRA